MPSSCWTLIPMPTTANPAVRATSAWVYQNLSVKSAAPHHAPSAGAWALLQWARRNSDKFFPLWARTMPHHAVQDNEPWKVQEDPQIRQIGQMIAAMDKEGGYETGDIDFSAPGSKPQWANMSVSP